MTKKIHAKVAILAIVVVWLLSACAPGQAFGSTLTPTPPLTPTSTLTPTITPTPTPDPIAKAIQAADQSYQSGDNAGAISQYAAILQQTSDQSVHTEVFAGLEKIGAAYLAQATLQRKNEKSHADLITACSTFRLAESAYAPILKDQLRPTFAQDAFYSDAAKVDVALIDCHMSEDTPGLSAKDEINSYLDTVLPSYPDDPALMDILVPPIVGVFNFMRNDLVFQNSAVGQEDLINAAQALSQKVGNYEIKGKKVSDSLNGSLANVAVCAQPRLPMPDLKIATSTTKKVESCPLFGDFLAIDTAKLRASNPSEVWFTLEDDYQSSPNVPCVGYYNGRPFTYSYGGAENIIYTLKNALNGQVVSSKVFYGTPPRCVFTTCTLNKISYTATCTGGEGHVSADDNVLTQWLQGIVR